MQPNSLPVLRTAGRAYGLLWEHRLLHLKAIWPPVVFLVTAEFLYHRIMGNADRAVDRLHAVLDAPWYMTLGAVAAWLAGLKFLLSFSISWRRHLLLGERFDPFFFKAPFWRYLGLLLLTYVWLVAVVLLSLVPAAVLAMRHAPGPLVLAAAVAAPLAALVFAVWGVVRQVPFFTVLTLGGSTPGRGSTPGFGAAPGWRDCTRAMRGTVWRYVAIFVLAMLPIMALNLVLDLGLKLADADRHAVHVALGEAAFRQAMLFIHFALGAAIGAITTTTILENCPRRSMMG